MKVTLDLTRLLAEGKINQAEFDKLSRLSRTDTGSLAFNILVGLGVLAVAGAALALVPMPITGVGIGGALMAGGLVLLLSYPAWLVLANICILVGALMFGGGVLVQMGGTMSACLGIAGIFMVSSLVARSGLLIALSLMALSAAIGAGSGYSHASYELSIEQPALTILLFGGLALIAYHVSKRVTGDFARLASIAARTSVMLVNFGFWIGSLWGDPLSWLRSERSISTHGPETMLPPDAFALAWALALLAVGGWAVWSNQRWVVNTVAVFGAIHFYTQWFERLSATPISVFVAGIATLLIAGALWVWNHRLALA